MAANLEYYKVFYYVAKYKNMTRAAAALFSNQPNVTRVMNLLEAELNCRLITRSNRGITLTAEGERLYAHVANAFEQIRMGEEELEQVLQLNKGVVFIGSSETALHGYLLEHLGRFHKMHPDVRLKIYNYAVTEALKALSERKIDFAIIPLQKDRGSGFRDVILRSCQDVLVGGLQFKYLADRGVHLKELVRYPFVGLSQATVTFESYRQLFWEHGVAWEPDIEVATTDLILPMIRKNLGIGFLPYIFAKEAIRKGEVVQIPVKDRMPERNICLVTDPHRTLSVAAQGFLKMLEEDDMTERVTGDYNEEFTV